METYPVRYLILLILTGCAHIPDECKEDYSNTLMHCPERRPEAVPKDCIEVYRDGRLIGCWDKRP